MALGSGRLSSDMHVSVSPRNINEILKRNLNPNFLGGIFTVMAIFFGGEGGLYSTLLGHK